MHNEREREPIAVSSHSVFLPWLLLCTQHCESTAGIVLPHTHAAREMHSGGCNYDERVTSRLQRYVAYAGEKNVKLIENMHVQLLNRFRLRAEAAKWLSRTARTKT
jgi:hypothetical protein